MSQFRRVPISVLRVDGSIVMSSPVFDSDGTKLIGEGVEITEKILERLKQRGIERVVVDESDLARLGLSESPTRSTPTKRDQNRSTPPRSGGVRKSSSNAKKTTRNTTDKKNDNTSDLNPEDSRRRSEPPVRTKFDNEIARGTDLRVTPQGPAFANKIKRHGATPYKPETVKRFTEEHSCYLEDLVPCLSGLAMEQSVELQTVKLICKRTLLQVAEDMGLFAGLATKPSTDSYLMRHSLNSAMLATSIGVTMGFDAATLTELSIGCLIHDVGMLQLDNTAYEHNRSLNNSEFSAIVNHPLNTINALRQKWDEIPKASLMVAYQIHERCNGSGYPRGRSETEIHDLARIGAVADTFTALVTPRPHREALLPFHAMKILLNDVKNGVFDSNVVRALLDTVSVYPIGSFVELNDRRVAEVIRANPGQFTRPIVELYDGRSGARNTVVIDLAKDLQVEVSRSIAKPELSRV